MPKELTPRERVRVALLGGKPDRVPVYPVITNVHASRVLGRRIPDFFIQRELNYDVLTAAWLRYGFDGFDIPVHASSIRELVRTQTDDEGKLWMLDSEGNRIAEFQEDDAPIPLPAPPLVACMKDIEKIPFMPASEYEQRGMLDGLRQVRRAVGEGAFLAAHVVSQTMNAFVIYAGQERALYALYDEPSFAHAVLERTTDATIEMARAAASTGVMDCIHFGDAWCSASILSPRHFREFALPQYKRFVNVVHKELGLPCFMHVCGNSTPLFELMAESGTDGIEPLDPLGGVRVAEAKARVGHRVCLKGGVNTITLQYGTPEETYAETLACLEAGMGNGGYILGTGDDIPRDAHPENIDAMVRAVQEHGRYA